MNAFLNTDLFRFVQEWVGANYPGLAAAEISITLTDGRKANLPVPVNVASTSPPAPLPVEIVAECRPVHLTPLQTRIVATMTGQTAGRKAAWIAAKIGAKCGGSFRSTLADMVRFGVLKRANDGGYDLRTLPVRNTGKEGVA